MELALGVFAIAIATAAIQAATPLLVFIQPAPASTPAFSSFKSHSLN